MKLIPEMPMGTVTEALVQDIQNARTYGKVRMGHWGIYFPRLFGTSCLPYSGVSRAWLRQEEVRANLCCGRANFDQFILVILATDGRQYEASVISKDAGKDALARLSAMNPSVQIGFSRENPA